MSTPEPIVAPATHVVPLPTLSGRDRHMKFLAGEAVTSVTVRGVDPRDVGERCVMFGSAGPDMRAEVFRTWGGRLFRPVTKEGPSYREPLPLGEALARLAASGKNMGGTLSCEPFVVSDRMGVVAGRGRVRDLPAGIPETRRAVVADMGAEVSAHVVARVGRDLFHDGQALYIATPFPTVHCSVGSKVLSAPQMPYANFPGARPDREEEYLALLDLHDPEPVPRGPQDRVGFRMACESLRKDLAGLDHDDGQVTTFANTWPLDLLGIVERLLTAARRPGEEVRRFGDLGPGDIAALRDGLQMHAVRASVGMLEGEGAIDAMRACAGAAAAIVGHANLPTLQRRRCEASRAYAERIGIPTLGARLAALPEDDIAGIAGLAR